MQQEPGIIWILGAGFSKPLGGPLLSELLTQRSSDRVKAVYGHFDAAIDPGRIPKIYEAGRERNDSPREWEHAEEFLERLDLAVQDGKEASKQILVAWCSKKNLDVSPHEISGLRFQGLRMLAAEVCLFLKDLDHEMERVSPYVVWAKELEPNDAVITFNYDRVVELVKNARAKGIWIPTPSELIGPQPYDCPIVLKMHGSVDWLRNDGSITRGDAEAALHCKSSDEIALATPGSTKQQMIAKGGVFAPLWVRAEESMCKAGAVVFVGYRMPATDAYTKTWLIRQLRSRLARENKLNPDNMPPQLPVHTVLGPGLQKPDSLRLAGLLREVHPGVNLKQWDMGTEDFLGLIPRRDLLHPPQ